jgi:hypothetical protein
MGDACCPKLLPPLLDRVNKIGRKWTTHHTTVELSFDTTLPFTLSAQYDENSSRIGADFILVSQSFCGSTREIQIYLEKTYTRVFFPFSGP